MRFRTSGRDPTAADRTPSRARVSRRLCRRLFPAMVATALLVVGAAWARAQAPIVPVQQHAVAVAGAGHLLQQVFGPMPAVAGTPFLGLAVLSGAPETYYLKCFILRRVE